jgi:hypothetical protein
MNTILELHDSKIAEIQVNADGISIHFEFAYLHGSESKPGIDQGICWTQPALLRFESGTLIGSLPDFPCTVGDGVFTMDSTRFENSIPVPLAHADSVTLHLSFPNTHSVFVQSLHVNLELLGEPNCIENF